MTKKPIFIIKKVKRWCPREDYIISRVGNPCGRSIWRDFVSFLNNKSSSDCYSRFKRLDPNLKKGRWNEEEDKILINLVEQYGRKWSKIAVIMKTRSSKQIRDRYVNFHDSNINRSKFTSEEDKKIWKLSQQFSKKWYRIKKFFPGRTTDMIKNRFYSTVKKSHELQSKNLFSK